MATTKLHYLKVIFLKFVEPNDIIDKFQGTGTFDEVGVIIRRIEGSDDFSRRQRVNIFLQWFENLDPEDGNKCQELLDVLDADDSSYKWLIPLLIDHEVLDDEGIRCLERLQKPDKIKSILQLLFPALTYINVEEVMHQMYSVFNDRDREEISKVVERQANHHALPVLLHKLIYKPPLWIETFIEAVETLNYGSTTPMFSESNQYATLGDVLRDFFGVWGEAMEQRMEIDEGPEPMLGRAPYAANRPEFCLRKHHDASKLSEDVGHGDKEEMKQLEIETADKKSSPGELKMPLRGYQYELCKAALLGSNVVICERTGSGKTLVAANIINQHLKNNKNGKVAFFTPTGGLAEQQGSKMEDYMPQRSADKTITVLRGNMDGNIDRDFSRKIYSSDIIVMTPQILLNCLKNKIVRSLFDFTMMIFDECHHARASHPYCEILGEYLKGKVGDSKKDIQVIGLTATLGIGGAENEEDAKANIFKLLGILDATGGIVIVRQPENVDELNAKCPSAKEVGWGAIGIRQEMSKSKDLPSELLVTKCFVMRLLTPDSDTLVIEIEDKDPFKRVIQNSIKEVIQLLDNVKALGQLGIELPREHVETLTKGFDGWCHKLREAAVRFIDRRNGELKHSTQVHSLTLGRDAKSCADTLLTLKEAYDLCRYCQPLDAINEIEKFVDDWYKEQQEKNTEMENVVYQLLNCKIKELKKCEKGNENMVLQAIEEKITLKNEEDYDFRCMIMVAKRRYAAYLKQWIQKSQSLKVFGADMYIGIGTKHMCELQGMTYKNQFEARKRFSEGLSKILVCTPDAAGEGIDILECNLVIAIDCVRDEVRRIQLKGRARKEGSEVLYINFRVDETIRDMLPNDKLHLMNRATARIEKMFKFENMAYQARLNEGKRQATDVLFMTEQRKRNAPLTRTTRRDLVLCRHCSGYICRTDELIRIHHNHTVNDTGFRSKYTRCSRQKTDDGRYVHRLRCNRCKCDWGRAVPWKKYLIPSLKMWRLKIEECYNQKVHLPRQWTKTNLEIPDFSDNASLCDRLFEKCDQMPTHENGRIYSS